MPDMIVTLKPDAPLKTLRDVGVYAASSRSLLDFLSAELGVVKSCAGAPCECDCTKPPVSLEVLSTELLDMSLHSYHSGVTMPDANTISPRLMASAPCCGHPWAGHHWNSNQCANCPPDAAPCPAQPDSPIGVPIFEFTGEPR